MNSPLEENSSNKVNYPAIIVELVNDILQLEKAISELGGRVANLESILGEA